MISNYINKFRVFDTFFWFYKKALDLEQIFDYIATEEIGSPKLLLSSLGLRKLLSTEGYQDRFDSMLRNDILEKMVFILQE